MQTFPVIATLPLAHLRVRLTRVPDGLTIGILSEVEAGAGKPADFSGVVDRSTAAELRRIADAIEAAA